MNMRSCLLSSICVFVSCFVGCSSGNSASAAQALLQKPEEPLDFLNVYPEPAEVVSLSSPDRWGFLLDTVDGDIQSPETVCASVGVGALLRPGDKLDYVENIRLTIDGKTVENEPHHNTITVAVSGDDGGEGPLSDLICWHVKGWFRPGIRLLSLLLWTSTEEEFSYNWAIEVTK